MWIAERGLVQIEVQPHIMWQTIADVGGNFNACLFIAYVTCFLCDMLLTKGKKKIHEVIITAESTEDGDKEAVDPSARDALIRRMTMKNFNTKRIEPVDNDDSDLNVVDFDSGDQSTRNAP